MTIGVVGTFIRDRIIPLQGPALESLGGLNHTLAYSSFLADGAIRIMPFARVGYDLWPIVTEAVAAYPGVETSGLRKSRRKNTQVDLVYRSADHRNEITSAPMWPLRLDVLEPLKNATGVLLNMITGKEISLASLREFATTSAALLYLDFHSLALGIDAAGKRYYRRPRRWRQWLFYVNVVQMNEPEAACLLGLPGRTPHPARLHDFVYRLLMMGRLHGVHITAGARGSLSGVRGAKGRIEIRQVPGYQPEAPVRDIIGCGDAFGAAFFVHYLRQRDFFAATTFANKIAALNTTFMGCLTRAHFENIIKPHATA